MDMQHPLYASVYVQLCGRLWYYRAAAESRRLGMSRPMKTFCNGDFAIRDEIIDKRSRDSNARHRRWHQNKTIDEELLVAKEGGQDHGRGSATCGTARRVTGGQ